MASVPTYRVFTKRKLEHDPYPKNPTKKLRRLGYRTFRDNELKNLDEILHKNEIALEGSYARMLIELAVGFIYTFFCSRIN